MPTHTGLKLLFVCRPLQQRGCVVHSGPGSPDLGAEPKKKKKKNANIYNITTLCFFFKETWVLTDLKGTTMRCTTRWQLPVFVLIFGLLHFPPPPPLPSPSPSPGVKGGPWHHRYTQLYTNSFGSVVLEVNESSQNLTTTCGTRN